MAETGTRKPSKSAPAAEAPPLRPDEVACLFAGLSGRLQDRVALAVSGGSDSTALMVLLAEWLASSRQATRAVTVLTVDHRLRPESAAEAEAVARRAGGLGFAHATLVWQADKPRAGLQAAARAARYRLLADYARAHGIGTIVTAHTADDQAETLLMRLARGSGLDGLSAMAPASPLQGEPGITLLRPLLEMPKARLQASLKARGIGWIEDPSNASPTYERTRLRAARQMLDELGLTTAMLGLSARRLQGARAALDRWVDDLLGATVDMVRADACGFFSIDLPRLRALPEEIVARVLARTIAAAGGAPEPVPLAALESIVRALLEPEASGGWTLARAKLAALPGVLLIEREPGRRELPHLMLAPGAAAVWDGRFRVSVANDYPTAVEVRALGLDGLRHVRRVAQVPSGSPAGALRALPAFWQGESLVAVPALGYWADEAARGALASAFIGLRG